jgi:hypothetical protein
MTAYSNVRVWCSDDGTQWFLNPEDYCCSSPSSRLTIALDDPSSWLRRLKTSARVIKTVQSRPTAKEMRAQTLSLACPRQRRATRSVPDLTSAGDLSFLQKHYAKSELEFSPLFFFRPCSSFLSSSSAPEKFPKSRSWQYGLLAISPRSISGSARLAGVAGNRQKTDDLRRNYLHKRHRREDHCVADVRTLGRRHLRRIHQNGGISRRAGRHAN